MELSDIHGCMVYRAGNPGNTIRNDDMYCNDDNKNYMKLSSIVEISALHLQVCSSYFDRRDSGP